MADVYMVVNPYTELIDSDSRGKPLVFATRRLATRHVVKSQEAWYRENGTDLGDDECQIIRVKVREQRAS